MRKLPLLVSLSLLLQLVGRSAAADRPPVTQVELQPLAAQVKRLIDSLDYLGAPLPQADRQALRAALQADSPNAQAMQRRSTSAPVPKVVSAGEVGKRFLELRMFGSQPLVPGLSGLALEYRLLQIYCRDAGRKEATL